MTEELKIEIKKHIAEYVSMFSTKSLLESDDFIGTLYDEDEITREELDDVSTEFFNEMKERYKFEGDF